MVRNLVVLGGSSHPQLTEQICNHLGIPPAKVFLGKFSVGETRVEIEESVRGKDVYVIQSGGGKVNDHLMELFITVSACKIASASRVTVILPLFPYSRQRDAPFDSGGPPAVRATQAQAGGFFTFDQSHPQTPYAHPADGAGPKDLPLLANGPAGRLPNKLQLSEPAVTNGAADSGNGNGAGHGAHSSSGKSAHFAAATADGSAEKPGRAAEERSEASGAGGSSADSNVSAAHSSSPSAAPAALPQFEPQPGYRQWVVQSGKLIADLLSSAGADHVITMDLHDPQYQGFFDIPVDNLYGRHLLKRYIQFRIPNHQKAVIVSPDAGGAKRATAIADALGMPFALIHKERRATQFSERQNATMMLVGDVADRTAILVDDMADTCNTMVRAAKLLKKEGATTIYGLVTHGILSGDAVERVRASPLDKLVVTNSVDQSENKASLGDRLDVLEVGFVFAEAIRRVHHGESISVLFQFG